MSMIKRLKLWLINKMVIYCKAKNKLIKVKQTAHLQGVRANDHYHGSQDTFRFVQPNCKYNSTKILKTWTFKFA